MASCKDKLKASLDHWKSLWVDPYKDKEQDEGAENKDILLDEVISRIGVGRFQVKLLFIVSLIWVADAMEVMMIAFISPALACEFNLTDSSKAALTAMVFFGMLLGAFAWGIVDDRYGRKKGLKSGAHGELVAMATLIELVATHDAKKLELLIHCSCTRINN